MVKTSMLNSKKKEKLHINLGSRKCMSQEKGQVCKVENLAGDILSYAVWSQLVTQEPG